MIIEPMQPGDIKAVLAIENASFSNPWHQLSFISELHQPHSRNFIIRKYTADNSHSGRLTTMVGFICYHLIGSELHLLKIAVKPDYRRQGIARQALQQCFKQESERGITAGILEVRESNTAGINLYKKMGFDVIGIRPYYYFKNDDQYEDAIIMKKTLLEGGFKNGH